jgi:hypothetical protein
MPAPMQHPHELGRERRLLQGVIILACLLPIAAGLAGIILGPAMIETASVGVNVDSHYVLDGKIAFADGDLDASGAESSPEVSTAAN